MPEGCMAACMQPQSQSSSLTLRPSSSRLHVVQVTDDAAADYALGLSKLAQHADYLVINVSSPNTPGVPMLAACTRLFP